MDQLKKDYTITELTEIVDVFIKQKMDERITTGPINVETISEPDQANGYSWTVQITMPAGSIPPELMHLFKPAVPKSN